MDNDEYKFSSIKEKDREGSISVANNFQCNSNF